MTSFHIGVQTADVEIVKAFSSQPHIPRRTDRDEMRMFTPLAKLSHHSVAGTADQTNNESRTARHSPPRDRLPLSRRLYSHRVCELRELDLNGDIAGLSDSECRGSHNRGPTILTSARCISFTQFRKQEDQSRTLHTAPTVSLISASCAQQNRQKPRLAGL
jgi:hypothetical protein